MVPTRESGGWEFRVWERIGPQHRRVQSRAAGMSVLAESPPGSSKHHGASTGPASFLGDAVALQRGL